MSTPKRPTLTSLEANFDKEASWAEEQFGPQFTGRMTKPGRPARGTVMEPTRPHSLRVQDSIWLAVTHKAQEAGITVNQAAQLALLEWAKR